MERPQNKRPLPNTVHSKGPRCAFSEERIARPFPWQQIKRKAFEESEFLTVEKIGTCVKLKPIKLPPVTLSNFKMCHPKIREVPKPEKIEYECSKVPKEKTPRFFRTKKRVKRREHLIKPLFEMKGVNIEKFEGKIILEYYDID